LSDYEQNLQVVINQGFAFHRNIGLAASVCAAADRIRADRERIFASTLGEKFLNEHFGTIGDRERFVLWCYRVQDLKKQFGTTHLHLFEDAWGRKAKWFASTTNLEKGTYEIEARVKRHEEYQGKRTTVLIDCNVVRKIEEVS
jgi:hypothetical protein